MILRGLLTRRRDLCRGETANKASLSHQTNWVCAQQYPNTSDSPEGNHLDCINVYEGKLLLNLQQRVLPGSTPQTYVYQACQSYAALFCEMDYQPNFSSLDEICKAQWSHVADTSEFSRPRMGLRLFWDAG